MVLSEAGDCGTTMIRVQCRDMGGNHETRHLNNYCPVWVMDIVCQVRVRADIVLLGEDIEGEDFEVKAGRGYCEGRGHCVLGEGKSFLLSTLGKGGSMGVGTVNPH